MLKRYIGDKAFYKYVLAIVLPIILQNGLNKKDEIGLIYTKDKSRTDNW